MTKPEIHWEVLTRKQKALLPQLKFLNKAGFYMAGGTALALQMGHRTSIDFDFYNKHDFKAPRLVSLTKHYVPDIVIENTNPGTLECRSGRHGLSAFHYPYELIRPAVRVNKIARLASLEDIAAMKMIAIGDRGKRRDFIDLYFLIRRFSLADIFGFINEKFPRFDSYHAFMGLTYFRDADVREERSYRLLLKTPSWKNLKKFFISEAAHFKRKRLGP